MSKTITVSDETYSKIKEQIEGDKKEEKKLEIKTYMGSVLFSSSKILVIGI